MSLKSSKILILLLVSLLYLTKGISLYTGCKNIGSMLVSLDARLNTFKFWSLNAELKIFILCLSSGRSFKVDQRFFPYGFSLYSDYELPVHNVYMFIESLAFVHLIERVVRENWQGNSKKLEGKFVIDKNRGWQGPVFWCSTRSQLGTDNIKIGTVLNFYEKIIGILLFRQSAVLKIINF